MPSTLLRFGGVRGMVEMILGDNVIVLCCCCDCAFVFFVVVEECLAFGVRMLSGGTLCGIMSVAWWRM